MPDGRVIVATAFAFFMDVNAVHKAFEEVFIPLYTVLAFVLCAFFIKFQPLDEGSTETPVYKWQKAGAAPSDQAPSGPKPVTPWKRRFFGTWEATGKDRVGFYDVSLSCLPRE